MNNLKITTLVAILCTIFFVSCFPKKVHEKKPGENHPASRTPNLDSLENFLKEYFKDLNVKEAKEVIETIVESQKSQEFEVSLFFMSEKDSLTQESKTKIITILDYLKNEISYLNQDTTFIINKYYYLYRVRDENSEIDSLRMKALLRKKTLFNLLKKHSNEYVIKDTKNEIIIIREPSTNYAVVKFARKSEEKF